MDGLTKLLDTQLIRLGDTAITLGQVAGMLLFILVGALLILWSARLLGNFMSRRARSPDLIQMITRAYLIIGFIVLAMITLDFLQIPLTAFAFISGAIAIGLGFGAQNIINNFISGWILMWERPIKIGDVVEIGTLLGTVESINTRSTHVKRFDGTRVLIPNSSLLENSVVNWTHRDAVMRSSVIVGVAYGSDVQLVKSLLEKVADEHPHVLKEPQRRVMFEDFGDSALIFELLVWANLKDEPGPREIRSDLRFAIDKIFSEHDIVISFPQRDIHVDGSISINNNS